MSGDLNMAEQTGQMEQMEQAPLKVGKRAKQTQQLVQMALKHIVEGWSYDNFEQSFPAIAKDSPESLSSMRDQTKEHFEKSVSTSIDALHDRRRVVQSLNSLDEMLDRVQKAKKENHKTAFGMSFKQRGEAFASDPFLAVKARKHAVVRSETEEVDRRIAEAKGETEELISKIKSLDAEEEKYDKEKSELGRLLNVLNEATRNIPQDEMSVVQSELNLVI